jgi:hypothetical protein
VTGIGAGDNLPLGAAGYGSICVAPPADPARLCPPISIDPAHAATGRHSAATIDSTFAARRSFGGSRMIAH